VTFVPFVVSVRRIAWCLFAGLFVLYNANGREIGSYDSQPTKLAAIELVQHGTLRLDRVVALAPDYGRRSAFQKDREGHYRSAYSVVPSLEAAVVAAALSAAQLVDLDAPLAPALVAVVTASLLTAAAVALVFLTLARTAGVRVALPVALGLGLGTNLWPVASQTLWQLETVTFGFALALFFWLRPVESITPRAVWLGSAGLALAGCARPAVAPMVAVVLAGLVARLGLRRSAGGVVMVAGSAAALMTAQWLWFGHVLGGLPALQAESVPGHAVGGTLSLSPWAGAAGLLFSPNRGLVIFSPIAAVALAAAPALLRTGGPRGERVWTLAAVVQFALYSSYSMWWGGHTYGPRYLLDTLVPFVPAAAAGTTWLLAARWRAWAGAAALSASIVIAATGALCFPHDRWNTDPADVDVHHARLWDWRDLQIVRCWQRGISPQNFALFDRRGLRAGPAEGPGE
jgi:hypothetical protein